MDQSTPQNKVPRRKVLGLTLLIAPTVIGIIAFGINIAASLIPPEPDFSSNSSDTLESISVILAIFTYITWLPGLVVGTILLTMKSASEKAAEASRYIVSPETPVRQVTPDQMARHTSRKAKYLTWGLISLIAPAAIAVISGAAVVMIAIDSFGSSSNNPNLLLDIFSGLWTIAVTTFVPGIIVGILTLIKRSKLEP